MNERCAERRRGSAGNAVNGTSAEEEEEGTGAFFPLGVGVGTNRLQIRVALASWVLVSGKKPPQFKSCYAVSA